MKQALELYNSKSYLQAEKEFLACKSEDELQATQYLFLISEHLKKKDLVDRFNEYLHQLALKSDESNFINLIINYPLRVYAHNWDFLLDAVWN
ncbi:MAG: hypothetical protein KC478_16010, partial [Bacteriovoracaceae bacterium]|nr:hypothetical protein [Bacteriovoracaceae bacterium]